MIDKSHQSKVADMEFIHQLMQEPLLDRDTEHELAIAWQENRDEKAFQKLIRSFTRLVVGMALRFRFYGLPIQDLIQEGTVGLIYAADRFDPEREVRFSTYAKWWIRATIQDYVLRNWSIVRTGSTSGQKQLFFNLRRLRNQLSSLSKDALSLDEKDEISKKLHVSINDIDEMEKRLSFTDLSLNTPMNDASDQHWQDFLPDERLDPEEHLSSEDSAAWREFWINQALNKLDRRERYIIQTRRLQDIPDTLEAIGKTLKISKERVRQLESRALRKMKHILVGHINEVKEIL